MAVKLFFKLAALTGDGRFSDPAESSIRAMKQTRQNIQARLGIGYAQLTLHLVLSFSWPLWGMVRILALMILCPLQTVAISPDWWRLPPLLVPSGNRASSKVGNKLMENQPRIYVRALPANCPPPRRRSCAGKLRRRGRHWIKVAIW